MNQLHNAILTQGYSAPHRIFSAEEASEYYNRFFSDLGISPQGTEKVSEPTYAWHHTKPWVWELATNPKLLSMAQQALGCEDVVLFGSGFWYKPAHDDKRVPWHQDGHSWQMDPCIAVTAWISLGHTTPENGGVRLLPGSHKGDWQHTEKADLSYYFKEEISDADVDTTKLVSPSLLPGEVLWFSEQTVHGSEPNTSDIPRLGFTARFCPSSVKFLSESCTVVSAPIRTCLVAGTDLGAGENQANRSAPSFL